MNVLVTGNAGFIGFHCTKALLERGDSVVGFDIVNDYYDPNLKESRLKILEEVAKETKRKYNNTYTFIRGNLADISLLSNCFKNHSFDRVIHLAAQAGVRYSLSNPHSYVESNIISFTNILECCRYSNVPHLTYASTSSVYGANTKFPFSEHDSVNHPLQFYAATKKANELMAHSYSHLFLLPTTGLRFFTVYGPWGRPDMALFKFVKNIINDTPIELYNNGDHTRDFTYVSDIVNGIIMASDNIATVNLNWNSENPDPSSSNAPYRIFNVGNNNPVQLKRYVECIENSLSKSAKIELLPLQPGDVPHTYADISELNKSFGYLPKVSVEEGVNNFVNWYLNYYK